MPNDDSGKLGFRYSRADAPLVDAEEYRVLLKSGKLSEGEAAWLRQFLMEYYAKPSKKQTKLHSDKQRKGNRRRASERERDVTSAHPEKVAAALAPKKQNNGHQYYSAADYKPQDRDFTPEELLILLEEQDEWP